METIESIFISLENKVKEIDTSMNITFGNTNLMKQQLRNIISYQEQLLEIKFKLDDVIKSTDKNSGFPIIPAAVGALLTLIGGATAGFGIDLTLGAIQHHSDEKEKRKNIRQRCISLQKNIEDIIQNSEILKSVASKSFESQNLMKYLHKKQTFKKYAELVANAVFWIILLVAIWLLFYSFGLLLQSKFEDSLGAFILAIITFLGVFKVAGYMSNIDKQWKILLSEIAENDHYK